MGSSFYGGGGQVSKKDFDALVEQVQKIDGTQAKHYSELAEEAARNAEADAERAEEVAREMESLDGRLDALETTVGDSSAGLVKDMSDAQGDISDLQLVANDPVYNANDKKLQLYDILNGDIPISFDDTEFIEITPGAYETTYPFRIDTYYTNLQAWSYAYATIKNASETSKYYIGYMGASPYNDPRWPRYVWNQGTGEFAVIEYNPNGEFSFNETSLGDAAAGLNLGWIQTSQYSNYKYLSIISMTNTDSGNFRIVHVRIECIAINNLSAGDYGVRGIRKYASDGSIENVYWPIVIPYADYTAQDALEALDFSAAVPEKDLAQLYVADTIYKPVDTQAREDISQLDSDLDTLGETVVTHGENIQTLFDTTDNIYEILQYSNTKPKSWSDTQKLVEDDLAKYIISVRDQFESGYGTNDTLLWDVLDFNHDTPTDTTKTKSMTLQTHYILNDTLAFSPREAFYAFTEAATAGKYYFTMGAQPWYAEDVNKIFEFELTIAAIPSGAQLVMTQAYNATGDGAAVKLYLAPGDLTEAEVVTMNIVAEPTSGATNLGTINRTKQSNLNCVDRALLGNNNWKESLLRQWLNTDGAADTWWTAQNIWDRPAAWVATTPGFMSYLDTDFKSVIGRTHVVTVRNTLCDGGGTDETDDYFFLISREEAYNGKEVSRTSEGLPYAYYKDYAAGSSPSTSADPNRVKTKKNSSTAQYWWYRTPFSGGGFYVRIAYASGALNYFNATNTYGVSPACNII